LVLRFRLMVDEVHGNGLKHQKEKRSMDHFAGTGAVTPNLDNHFSRATDDCCRHVAALCFTGAYGGCHGDSEVGSQVFACDQLSVS
jgi:hypothetical protein